MTHAIVVGVPEARDDCFLAIPFAGELSPLQHNITSAAADLSLRRVRVQSGEMEPGIDYVQDICDGIRAARLVVAVCFPDDPPTDKPDPTDEPNLTPKPNPTKKPNPNVAYELGYAHALGKPTLILTCNPPALPANVVTRHALTCDRAEFGTPELTRKIREAMRAVLQRGGPLTDLAFPHVHAAQERIFYNSLFWEHFRCILSFARLIHDEHQQIITSAADPFYEQTAEMMNNPRQSQRMVGVINAWGSYEGHFLNLTRPRVYAHLDRRLDSVERAFEYLNAETGDELREAVTDCHGFYLSVRDQLHAYPRLLGDTVGLVPDPLTLLQHREMAKRLFLQAGKIRQATRTIVIHSGGLIFNLVDLIQKAGE